MSAGLVICSVCRREVHQDGPPETVPMGDGRTYQLGTWCHCEDRSPRCGGAQSIYPTSRAQIVGRYCGCDGFEDEGTPV